jgi:hypothetical protein
MKRKACLLCTLLAVFLFTAGNASAGEVDKGKISAEHLSKSLKELPWGSPIWDVKEAVAQLNTKDKVLWIDTRPQSFYDKGTVAGAILLPYNKTGKKGNDMTEETLALAVSDAGLSKDTAKIIMFCQGPKCHRSYNATYIAVTKWGYNPANMIWFRAGYPHLFKEVQSNPKLKRKAKKYISDAGVKQL